MLQLQHNNHSPEPTEYCQGTIMSCDRSRHQHMQAWNSSDTNEIWKWIFLWYFNQGFIHKIKLIWVEIKKWTTYNIYIHSKSCSLTLCSPNTDLHSLSSPLQSYNGLNPDKSWWLFLTNQEQNTAVILFFHKIPVHVRPHSGGGGIRLQRYRWNRGKFYELCLLTIKDETVEC